MEYIYLAAACGFFGFQFIFSKLYQRRTDGTLHAALWSALLSMVAMFLFFIPYNLILHGHVLVTNPAAWMWGCAYAVCGVVCSVCTLLAMKTGSVSAVVVYCLLGGMVLPALYGIFFEHEQPSVWRWIGLAVLTVAILPPMFLNGKKADTEAHSTKDRVIYVICSLLVFLTNGGVSIITTVASRYALDEACTDTDFLLICSALRLAMAAVLVAVVSLSRKQFLPVDRKTGRSAAGIVMLLLFGILLCYTVLNGMGNVFNLLCAKTMDATIQYPVISASCIVISTVAAYFIFKEKPGRGDLIGVILSIIGIVLCVF